MANERHGECASHVLHIQLQAEVLSVGICNACGFNDGILQLLYTTNVTPATNTCAKLP